MPCLRIMSLVVLVAGWLAAGPSPAADWMGKKIIPKSDTAPLRVESGPGAGMYGISWPATVKSMDGRWLQIVDDGGSGAGKIWIRSDDVLLFHQSLNYFNDQLHEPAAGGGLFWLRGICWEYAQEFNMAAKDYQAALVSQPNNLDARLGLARTTAKSKYDDAKFVAAWQLGRSMPRLLVDWGDALAADKQPQRARAMYNEAVRLNPNWRMPHYSLAKLAASQGSYHEALAGYDEAIRRDATFHVAYRDRATAALASSKDKSAAATALASARRACELCYFRDAESLAALAESLAAFDNWSDAMRYQQMAVEYAPLTKKKQHEQRWMDFATNAAGGQQLVMNQPAQQPGERPRGFDAESSGEVSRGAAPRPRLPAFIDRSARSFE